MHGATSTQHNIQFWVLQQFVAPWPSSKSSQLIRVLECVFPSPGAYVEYRRPYFCWDWSWIWAGGRQEIDGIHHLLHASKQVQIQVVHVAGRIERSSSTLRVEMLHEHVLPRARNYYHSGHFQRATGDVMAALVAPGNGTRTCNYGDNGGNKKENGSANHSGNVKGS